MATDQTPLPDGKLIGKITDWTKEPTIQDLKGDLEQATPSQNVQMQKIQKWNDLSQVKGAAKPKPVKGHSSVQPKLIRRQAEWRYSALTEPFLGSDKMFTVNPATYADQQAAEQNELVLNWQFRTKMNKVKFIDDYVRSTVDDGTCIVRLGWDRTVIEIPTEVPVYSYYPIQNQDQLQQFQQAMELKQTNPRGFDQLPDPLKQAVTFFEMEQQATVAVQTGVTEQKLPTILTNKPTLEVLNPENVFIDPSCQGDLSKALFVVVSFETNKAELKKNPDRYKNLDKVNWEGNTPMTNPTHATSTPNDFQFKDTLRKKVVAYEYWGWYDIDGEGELTAIVATWIGDVMIRLEKNPFPDEKLPFVLVPYMPVKRELYGEADAELLEDNQKVLGAVVRGMVDVLGRSANGQQGFAKGMLDPLNRRRFDNGQDYEFNPNQNPQGGGLIEHTFPELPNSALTMFQLQNQEAEALTGVKSFAGGVSGEAYGDVAAGIRGALDASAKREMAILRRLAKGMVEIGTKIIAMNTEWLSEEETVRVTNEQFVTISREDLRGNFELEVDIATAEVDNQKSQDLGFMLQTLGPKVDWNITKLILVQIAKLKRMPVLAQSLEEYQPQPDPVQQQLQQLELQLKEAQIENERAQAQLYLAQAGKQSSEADLKNLDFVEQETGTKHARAMDLQKAQSEGNQNLAVTKALTQPVKEGEKKPNIPAAVGFNALTSQNSAQGAGQAVAPSSTITRDMLAGAGTPQGTNPANIGSSHFDASQDPSLNPAINL